MLKSNNKCPIIGCVVSALFMGATVTPVFADDLVSIVQNLDGFTKIEYSVAKNPTQAPDTQRQANSAADKESDLIKAKGDTFHKLWQSRVLGILAQQFVIDMLPQLNKEGVTLKRFDAGTFSVAVDVSSPDLVLATVYDMSGGEVTALKIPINN